MEKEGPDVVWILIAVAPIAAVLGGIFWSFTRGKCPGVKKTPVVPPTTRRLTFGCYIPPVSYGRISGATYEQIDHCLSLVDSVGARIYNPHVGFDPWLFNNQTNIAKQDYVKTKADERGKLYHISDSAAEYYWSHRFQSKAEAAAAWLNRITTLTERYRPAIYTVIKEPQWYEKMFDFPFPTPEEWATLTKTLTAKVKSISPTTKTCLALVGQFSDFNIPLLQGVADDPNLDVVGWDIYGKGWCGEDDKTSLVKVQLPHAGTKVRSIPETWAQTGAVLYMPQGEKERALVEQNWAVKMSQFATDNGFQMLEWFFTERLGSAETLRYIKEVVEAYQT